MLTTCKQPVGEPSGTSARTSPRGVVIDLQGVRLERLATEIANQLRAAGGAVTRRSEVVGDVDRWRRAARRAGRLLDVPVRTGVSIDGSKVWVVDES
jgi:hypothetical protein